MSQWPGKTLLAIRRPVLPLPPDYAKVETLAKNLDGISHIVFDPFDKANAPLKQKLSMLSSRTKTLDLQRHGVIVAIGPRQNDASPSPTTGQASQADPAAGSQNPGDR